VYRIYFIFIFILFTGSAQSKSVPSVKIEKLLNVYIENRGFTIDEIISINNIDDFYNVTLDSINCYYEINRCRVNVYYTDKIRTSFWFYVKTKSKANFTIKTLNEGDLITVYNVGVKYGDNFRCRNESNTVKKMFVSKLNSKQLKKDKVICKSDLTSIHTIFKGSDVKLISTVNNVLFEIKVRAISSGTIGDEINVLVKSSGKVIMAKVISSNTVEYIN